MAGFFRKDLTVIVTCQCAHLLHVYDCNLGCFSDLLFIPDNCFTTWRMVWQETIGAQYGQYSTVRIFHWKKLATKCFGVFFEVLSPHTSPFSVCFCNMTHGPLCIGCCCTGHVLWARVPRHEEEEKVGTQSCWWRTLQVVAKWQWSFALFRWRPERSCHYIITIHKIHCIIYIHIQIHIHMIQCPAAPPPPYVGHFEQKMHFILGKDWLCSSKKRIRFWGNPSPTLRNSVTDFGENQPATLGKWATDFGKKSFGGHHHHRDHPIQLLPMSRAASRVLPMSSSPSNNSYVTTMSWMRQSYPGEVESVWEGWMTSQISSPSIEEIWGVNPFILKERGGFH